MLRQVHGIDKKGPDQIKHRDSHGKECAHRTKTIVEKRKPPTGAKQGQKYPHPLAVVERGESTTYAPPTPSIKYQA